MAAVVLWITGLLFVMGFIYLLIMALILIPHIFHASPETSDNFFLRVWRGEVAPDVAPMISERYPATHFFLRLWRGEIALWITCWMGLFSVGIVGHWIFPVIKWVIALNVAIVAFVFRVVLGPDSVPKWVADLLVVVANAITVLYAAFIFVCIWRSADHYARSHRLRLNATLAKAVVVLGSAFFVFLLFRLATGPGTYADETTDEKAQYLAAIPGLNADLPKKVDRVTTLTKIDFNGNEFRYFETISAKIDKDGLMDNIKSVLVDAACKDSDKLSVLKNGINFKFIYSDSDGQPLGEIAITKSDCPA